MVARLGLEIYKLVNKFARKLAAKPDKKGIMQIPNQETVRNLSNDILTKFMKHNVSREALKSENDIKVIYNHIKNIEEQTLARNLKKTLTPKKSADVLNITGKKIDTSKPILGGKNVPETEEQILQRLNKQNKETVERLRNKEGPIDWDEVDKIDPEDFAGGGAAGRASTGLNYLLGEDDQNSRVPFGLGGMGRRAFLKLMGAGAAGTAAAKSGLLSIFKGGATKSVIKDLTSVPIKDISGMPAWFKPLVNKVIKEGDDVTKKFADADRQIVHTTKLPNSQTDVIVTQDLNTGDVLVDIGMGKHGFKEGHLGQPVRLEYKAAEDIMSGPDMDEMFKVGERDPLLRIKSSVHEDLLKDIKPSKKGLELRPGKTKEEFWVEEAEFTGGHPENVKFEEVSYEKFGEHGSNFDEVEKFATGKVKKVKRTESEFLGQKSHYEWDESALQKEKGYVDEAEKKFYEGKASGGRVPLAGGKLVKYATPEGLAKLIEKLFPGTTKLGQTSKPMAEKTQLKRAIARFQERNKIDDLGGSKADPFSPDFDMRAEMDLIARTPYTPAELKQLIIKKYKGNKLISDDLLNKILADNDPQRLTEVMATIDEALIMQGKGMGPDEIINMFKKTPRTKNASGGRVPLAGGGPTLKFLKKIFGSSLDDMPRRDPELYKGLLEVVPMFRSRNKKAMIDYMEKYLPHKSRPEIEEFILGADDDVIGNLIRLGSGRDYKGKMEMIKKLEKTNRLRDFDVTGRKPNASGGLAGMLGE